LQRKINNPAPALGYADVDLPRILTVSSWVNINWEFPGTENNLCHLWSKLCYCDVKPKLSSSFGKHKVRREWR